MLSWCEFPKEILNMVFLYVNANDRSKNKKDLSQCSLTCRGWRASAQAVFFSKVSVETIVNIDSLICVALENNELKSWVKVLKYSSKFKCSSMALIAADTSFPNLEILDFFSDNLLYSSFYKMLTKNKKFKKLKKLPLPVNKEQDIVYIQCLNFLREQVTSITWFDDAANNRDIYQGVIDKLDKFPKLKKILIRTTITADMQYQNLVKYINPIIENSMTPSLQEVCINSATNDSYCFRLSTRGQKSLVPFSKLKSLDLYMRNKSCFNVSNELITFIMNHCSNIDSLYIENVGDSFYYRALSYQVFLQFVIYLSKIPNFVLKQSMLYSEEAIRLIDDFYTTIGKEPAPFDLSRTLTITAHSYLLAGYITFPMIAFKNDYARRLQSVDYGIICSKYPAAEIDQEQIQIVEKIGRFFNTISLQITSPEHLVALLKCMAAIHCERLDTTLIIDGRLGSIFKESLLQDKTITHNYNLKELVLSNCCLSQEQLLYISVIVPHLKKLSLKNFLKHKSLPPGKSFFSFCLPNWTLDRLEIDMDTDFTCSEKEKIYHIKLVTEVEQNSRYCFFTAKFTTDGKITGYSLINSPTQAAFQESISDPEVSTYHIFCISVKMFCFKYVDAEDGYHKSIDLFGEPMVA